MTSACDKSDDTQEMDVALQGKKTRENKICSSGCCAVLTRAMHMRAVNMRAVLRKHCVPLLWHAITCSATWRQYGWHTHTYTLNPNPTHCLARAAHVSSRCLRGAYTPEPYTLYPKPFTLNPKPSPDARAARAAAWAEQMRRPPCSRCGRSWV